MAGAARPSSTEYRSLVPLLRGAEEPAAPSRALYWHYPHYHPGGATPYSAIREGEWKLIEFFEDKHVELYRLADDPREERDLAAAQPAKVAELKGKLQAWREKVGAQYATPNPDYDAARETESPRPNQKKKKG
jgi:arylsulfatase A-like enzyme